MKKFYTNKITICFFLIIIYFGGIKLYTELTKIFERNNVFLSTNLIYINPYATKYDKENFLKSKQEESKIKENIKKDPLASERYYWGEWDFETNPSIHKSKYQKEFLLLANTAREFNKIVSKINNNNFEYKKEKENILSNLKKFESIYKNSPVENKENANKYINQLINISTETINSKDILKLQSIPLLIEQFAIDYENILNDNNINQDLVNQLNL